MVYEDHRLNFLNSDGTAFADAVSGGDNWQAFISKVDIAAVFEAVQRNEPLTSELVKQSVVVLVRQDLNSYRAYTTDVSRIGELAQHPLLAAASG